MLIRLKVLTAERQRLREAVDEATELLRRSRARIKELDLEIAELQLL